MTRRERKQSSSLGISRGTALAVLTILALAVAVTPPSQAQTYTTIYNFSTITDGNTPNAGLTIDGAGNLYGSASSGGYTGGTCYGGCGTVFKLSHKGSGWVFSLLYEFHESDGYTPQARVIFGPDGNLYGTTTYGGASGEGVVFRLQP